MKQKITLVVLMFLVTLFAFGQRTEFKHNELFWKPDVEKQLKGLKQHDYKVMQGHLSQKIINSSQNSSTKSTQVIKQSLDSIVSLQISSQWVISAKSEFTYDTNGNVTQNIEFHWIENTNEWVNVYKGENTYDTYGNIT